jgi:serine/threonine protein kinase
MPDYSRELPFGYLLNEYKILKVLGQGAFGITYLAEDTSLESSVAIKEYFPREFSSRDSTKTIYPNNSREERELFQWGKDSFIEEGKTLARFDDPNIVQVRRFFELNGTAYLVMDFCDGEPLDALLNRRKQLLYDELVGVVKPLLSALDKVHSAGFLHRDIKPGNIFIKNNGVPILLDFGAARQRIFEQSRSMTSLATPGYAALEQYSTSGTSQGPYTDIYGLAATIYRAITGERPPESTDRLLNETYKPLTSQNIAGEYSKDFLVAIDKALSIRPINRHQNIGEFRDSLFKNENKKKLEKELIQQIDAGYSGEISGLVVFGIACICLILAGLLKLPLLISILIALGVVPIYLLYLYLKSHVTNENQSVNPQVSEFIYKFLNSKTNTPQIIVILALGIVVIALYVVIFSS